MVKLKRYAAVCTYVGVYDAIFVSPRLCDEFKGKIHIRCGKEIVVAAGGTATVINKK